MWQALILILFFAFRDVMADCAPGLLSEAYHSLAQGNISNLQRKREESQSAYKKAIDSFLEYRKCGSNSSYLSAYGLAFAYSEIGDLRASNQWNQVALQEAPHPEVRDVILLQSRIFLRQGKGYEAIEFLEDKLSEFPYDSDFLFLLGTISQELRQTNKAVLYYTSLHDAILKREGNPRYRSPTLRALGELYFSLNQPKKSLHYYLMYLGLQPSDWEAHFRVSQLYYFLGDFSSSKRYLQKILQENPRDLESSHLLAEMYFVDAPWFAPAYFAELEKEKKIPQTGLIRNLHRVLLGEKEKVSRDLAIIVTKNPGRLSARVAYQASLSEKTDPVIKFQAFLATSELAFTYRQFWVAKSSLEEALKLAGTNDQLRVDSPALLERISRCEEELGQPNKALLTTKRALSLVSSGESKTALEVRMATLLSHESLRRYEEGMRIAERLLKSNPESSSLHYLAGLIEFQKKDYSKSQGHFTQAIERDPNNASLYFYRALVLEKMGLFESMERDLEDAIRLNPESPNQYNFLGYVYAEKGIQLEKAKELIAKAVSLEPDNGAYQDSLGWVYFKLGELDEASLHLKLAEIITESRNQEDPVIYDHLGDVYRKKQDPINAIVYWEKSKKWTKSTEDLQRLQKKIDSARTEIQ